MKFFDAFSGYGGFHLGIERAYENYLGDKEQMPKLESLRPDGNNVYDTESGGKNRSEQPTCIGYSEIDKYASAVYKYHFGGKDERTSSGLARERECDSSPQGGQEAVNLRRASIPQANRDMHDNVSGETTKDNFQGVKNYGDITTIDPTTIPDFDLFCGGFPCQAFSIAGKRKGFDDTRGTLFFDIARILKEKRPKHLLLENVKGLLSHDSGRTFQTILRTLSDLGYGVEWQVLNAKDFGVPQNRERVFIIGHLGGFSGRQVFPIRGDNEETKNTTHPTIDANYYKGHSNQRRVMAVPVLTPDRPEKRQNGRRFKENGDPSFTLTGQDKHGVYDGYKIRRLTPKECERLMGLPDDWTSKGDFDGEIKEISDTQRYKLCGNGVVVNVVEYIIDKLFRIKK
jgi:DNA (cytosine-5)-methyltransferase 1